MSDTRRNFLYSATAAAAGIAASANAAEAQTASKPLPASPIQVPTMKFGKVEISRLVCGVNQFYGFAHFNQILQNIMKEWYTPERVADVLHRCNSYGINAYNYVDVPRSLADFQSFQQQGGKMNLICQGMADPVPMIKALKPHAVYCHGELTDKLLHQGEFDDVKEWCKKVRDLGPMVGVGTHNPEVIAMVEDKGWDVDFYAGCVYNRTRTREEWQKVLNGQLVEGQSDCYLVSDPPLMYKALRATKKPCFAFKIMAAGRAKDPEQAFRTAYESIKPTDGVFIGLFPRFKDEIKENAQRVQRLLRKA